MVLEGIDLSLSYGDRTLIDHQNLVIEDSSKMALIGVNGTGKSSLLRLLAEPEKYGTTLNKRKGLQVAYLPQIPEFTEKSVEEEIRACNAKRAHPVADYELASILTKLDLTMDSTPVETLSGGQKRRLALACVLFGESDLLILDEPTNHLDQEMISWLENQLISRKGALLMVTHDRYFLERVCNQIVELDHGKLYTYDGNYEQYLEAKAERERINTENARKHRNLYRKELDWVRAGVQARSTKSQARLDRFEELRKQRYETVTSQLDMSLPSSRLGKKTISWERLSFGYPGQETLFEEFSSHLTRTDRVGFIGPNGCGKTTLLKILTSQLQPISGTVETGETVRIGYFRQEDQIQDLSMRVIDFIEEVASTIRVGDRTISASMMLERFLFDDHLQYMPIERLSGGERRRLMLLRVLMSAPNVLVLDEPTNDLDLKTLEVLEDYLDEFPGIVILVSHDRYFMDRVCDFTYVLDGKSWTKIPGGYTEAMQALKEITRNKKAAHEKTGKKRARMPQNGLNYKEKRELAELETKMETLQKSIASFNTAMETETDFEILADLAQKRDQAESELEAAEERWMELEEKKEQTQDLHGSFKG